MELWIACAVGCLVFCGTYLILRARTFAVALGLTLLSYAINIFLFSMGRLKTGQPAVLGSGAEYTDPVPQALVLTAIVIGFAMTAFILVLALRSYVILGTDHVDGSEKPADKEPL